MSGTCKTLYTITETTNEDLVTVMNITKVRDLTNCTKTAFNKLMTFTTKNCEECEKVSQKGRVPDRVGCCSWGDVILESC